MKTVVLSVFLIFSCSAVSALPGNGVVTVGRSGMFITLQSALDAHAGEAGQLVIRLSDNVHTEAGVVIEGDVSIIGESRGVSVIQASGSRGEASDRVFTVKKGGSLELRGLTIRYGRPSEVPYRGGGIDNEGRLIMYDCAVAMNDAVYGAGIFTRGRTELYNCAVFSNDIFPAPPAVRNSGTGCVGSGGGIKTENGADLYIENSAIYGNSSISRGGGIFVACESRAEIINTTIIENKCRKRGGGICNKGDLLLNHVTLAFNKSIQRGSGLCNMGRLSIFRSLITGNSYGDFVNIKAHGFYGEGFIEQQADNFVADGSLPGAAEGNPRIRKPVYYPGKLPVVRIKWFSPLRNAVISGTGPETDQRGVLRDMRPDIGAYELRPVPWR